MEIDKKLRKRRKLKEKEEISIYISPPENKYSKSSLKYISYVHYGSKVWGKHHFF